MNLDPSNPWEFLLTFSLIWVVGCFGLSLFGGWFFAAKHYMATEEFEGETWNLQSASFGYFVSYGGCLTIGGNRHGMRLSVLFPFRLGHSPLFIPWSDITRVAETSRFFGVTLVLRLCPSVKIKVSPKLIRRLEEAKGSKISVAP